jgi:hypothetical protein
MDNDTLLVEEMSDLVRRCCAGHHSKVSDGNNTVWLSAMNFGDSHNYLSKGTSIYILHNVNAFRGSVGRAPLIVTSALRYVCMCWLRIYTAIPLYSIYDCGKELGLEPGSLCSDIAA